MALNLQFVIIFLRASSAFDDFGSTFSGIVDTRVPRFNIWLLWN